MDFLEGKCLGVRRFLTQYQPHLSNILNRHLHSWEHQVIFDFTQNFLNDEVKQKGDGSNKKADSEIESRAGNELLSGKKESTTASRSPNSDLDKKENEEIVKSAICEFEQPKNPHDIRSYFKVTMEKKKQIQANKIFTVQRKERCIS